MEGRVCLITGATSGIGKAAAAGLARLGATVVIGARTAEKGEQALREIRAASGSDRLAVLAGDLASLAQVRAMAEDFGRRFGALHVLVNNAGVQRMRRELSADGLEATFAVNYLAHFLLTHLLLGHLRNGAPSRVVNVASVVHRWASLDPDDLQTRRYETNRAYNRSKLAMVYLTYGLARRLEGSGVTVNCMEPGLVDTDFARDFSGAMALGNRLMGLFKKTPERGAQPVVYLASSPEVAGLSGRYFAGLRAVRSSPASYDARAAEALWRRSLELAGLPPDFPYRPTGATMGE